MASDEPSLATWPRFLFSSFAQIVSHLVSVGNLATLIKVLKFKSPSRFQGNFKWNGKKVGTNQKLERDDDFQSLVQGLEAVAEAEAEG